MLVLTRAVGEKIYIGGDIVVTVTEVNRKGRSVKLEFIAPQQTTIVKGEHTYARAHQAEQTRPTPPRQG